MTQEKRAKNLRAYQNSSLVTSISLFFCLITFIAGALWWVLEPFFDNFYAQSIGGMGLK